MAFRDIIGQDQALAALKTGLKRDKLAHSLLFSGPEGTGKHLAATGLAMELNCKKPENEAACGKCPDCRQISKSVHPDVSVIAPEGKALEIKIDAVRSMRREMHMKPVRSGYKIFILDKAEKLNSESANALLKVLEEPPEKSLLVLLSSRPYSLLPTIVSRCQTIKFRRLSIEDTEKILVEKLGIPPSGARLPAGLSQGSPGKAVFMLNNGLDRRKEIFDWAFPEEKTAPGLNAFEIMKTGGEKAGLEVKDSARKRENLMVFFEILLSWYSDALVSSAGGNGLLNEDFTERIKKHALSTKIKTISKAMKILLSAQEQILMFANPKLVFEVAMIDITGAERR